MSEYERSGQSPQRRQNDPYNNGQIYSNPAFTPQSQGMNYDTSYDHSVSDYSPQSYGRTPLQHQTSQTSSHTYGQGYEQSQQVQSGAPQNNWDGGYGQQQRGISPQRSRGVADDSTDYSYGHQQQQHQQSRALLPQDNWDNGYGHQDNQVPMRQIQHNQFYSHEPLQHNRPPPVPAPHADYRSPSAPPAATLDRSEGVGSRNSATASSVNLGFYSDSPYQRYSTHWNPETSGLSSADLSLQAIRRNSQDSEDEEMNRGKRTGPLAGAIGLGGVFGKKAEAGSTVSGLGANSGLLSSGPLSKGTEQDSSWLQEQKKASKKSKWLIAGVIIFILLLIGGGVAAGVIISKKNQGSGGGGGGATSSVNAEEDQPDAPPVNTNTDSIKALMNNPNLHKSFYGMDYTPLNAIFPECLMWPPTQNNITKDIAVISQLTSRLRLYGNDCNQTEMVLEAIKILEVDMKVWLGVYIDNNATTNNRQLDQMYTLLETYGTDPWEGVVIGNEALFRKEITEYELTNLITNVRQNFTNLGYTGINITTSDLGSAWTATLAGAVDTVMANVHPFFAGVTVEDAPGWTWEFTENNDVAVARQTLNNPNVIISEVGWPSGGGTLLGSVAGVKEMNTFLENFVCTANQNGTEYFWFVPFDEPWKEKFNEPGKEWETQWGLMDVNRNLKSGVVIPDCTSN